MSAPEFTAEKMKDRFATHTPKTTFSGMRTPSSADDTNDELGDTQSMSNDITRAELDAKLDATNARIDARLASFEGTVREAMAANRQDYAEMRGELKAIHVDLSYLKNIKSSIWGAAGATVLGVGGLVAAMLSFGIANYDTARENTNLAAESKAQIIESHQKVDSAITAMNAQLAETRRQSEETAKLLEQMKAQQDAAPSKAQN